MNNIKRKSNKRVSCPHCKYKPDKFEKPNYVTKYLELWTCSKCGKRFTQKRKGG